jgi:oligopeptide transport system substrate-binding protein
MKPTRKLISCLLVVLFLLLACQVSGRATPVALNGSTANPFTLNGVIPTPGIPDSSTTAPSTESSTFVSQENGVTVHYPAGWTTHPPEQADGSLVTFISPDQSVQSEFFVFPAQPGDTAESVTSQMAESALQGFQNITTVSEAALVHAGASSTWSRLVTATSSGNRIKINFTTLIYGAREYFLLTHAPISNYDANAKDLNSLLNGINFQVPGVSGVNRKMALFLSGGESTNSRDYDPATEQDSGDKRIYSGLVSLDPNLNLTPDLAKSWTLSADGSVYTFHLRTNARFHDGRPVVAQDVIYSWERAATPATQSNTVLTYLGDILGVAEMHNGKANHISGLKAIDEHTLQVTIDTAKSYFLYKLTLPVAFVLDKKNVESGPQWFRTPNGTGPYKLTRWDSFKLMVYAANPDYYLGAPSIPQIAVQLYTGVGLNLYESGEIDMTAVSSFDTARVLDPADLLHADLRSGVSLCTEYVVFDVTKPPFDDVKVRQAFTLAFDRQKYIDVVKNGIDIPAKGLYPPSLPGYNKNLKSLPYDPKQARQFLAQSKFGGPQGLPPIVYTTQGFGNNIGAGVAAMVQMWEQNLGVKITIENLEPDKYLDMLYSGRHGQIFSSNWCADYPDPENFADLLFHSGAQQNIGNYSSPALDALLEQARGQQDVSKRIQLYQQAEQMIIQDAPALFLSHPVTYMLVKPYVKGFVLTPIDVPIERYLSLQH